MYPIVLLLHSFLRWVVILLGVWAVVSVLPSRQRFGRPVSPLPGLLFSTALDVQLLAGLLLYGALSPMTTAAMRDMGAAMKNGAWRYLGGGTPGADDPRGGVRPPRAPAPREHRDQPPGDRVVWTGAARDPARDAVAVHAAGAAVVQGVVGRDD